MKRALVVLVSAMAVVLAACGSSSHSGPAAKSKTVTLLTHDAFAVSKPVLAAFEQQSGYKVKLVQPGDAGLVVNDAILRKEHPVADALFGVDNTFLSRTLNADIFEPYMPSAASTIKAGVYTDPQHRVTPIDEGYVCVDYDNTWFGKNGRPPAPTGFASLTDPRYKNLAVVENPATSSPGLAFLLATEAKFGESGAADYWRQLRKNGIRVVDDWTAAYETDFTAGGGSGDRPIVVSYASSPPADVVGSTPHRDMPRVSVVPTTCFEQFEFAGVLRHAGNPDGARALVDFMLSRQFQDDMPLEMYVDPVVTSAQVPAVYAKWRVTPEHPYVIDPATIGAHRDAWIKQWTDIVTR